MTDFIESTSIADMIDEYRRKRHPIRWPLPSGVEDSVQITYRAAQAQRASRLEVDEMIINYLGFSVRKFENLYQMCCRHLLETEPTGIGVELGSGCALMSALVARNPAVEAIFAVEIVEEVLKLLSGKTATHILGTNAAKVIPVVGSFDDIRLPDESIDFVIETHSLHHSDNLAKAFRETARVLRKSGVVICFDRVQPDSMTDEHVDRLLDHIYTPQELEKLCYPSEIRLTRRNNGEHEYRRFEWKAAIEAAGLGIVSMTRFFVPRTRHQAFDGLQCFWAKAGQGEKARSGLRDCLAYMVQPFRHRFGRQLPASIPTTCMILKKIW